MQRPLQLMQKLIEDSAQRCSTTHYLRDIETMKRRYEHEGLSFLTITLPCFLEDFMMCLEEGHVGSTRFHGWKKRGCLPAFLQGFTHLVFDEKGDLRENESHQAIHCVRQICSFFKKVKLACSPERTNKAFQDYKRIDKEVLENFQDIDDNHLDTFISISRLVVSTVFNREIDLECLIPHHGPGSTQEKVLGNAKYIPSNYPWINRLSQDFPLEETLFSTDECYHLWDGTVETIDMEIEPSVRVVSVPKTLKTPRIIALEPVSMQMCQQAVKDVVVREIERSPLTAGHVNFSDQSINGTLALRASIDRSFATLDLSAASDRVSKDIIYLMLSVHPQLRSLVFNTRSHTADVNGEIIWLNKFASMGSALCFPMEALYFFILSIQALLENRDLPVTLTNIKKVCKDVYVYGDDIIVPINDVDAVVNTLSSFGNVVGLSKSFSRGFFRESCGVDAYKGFDITPIYLRQIPPTAGDQASRIVSCIETANQLHKVGFVATAEQIVRYVHSAIGKLPIVHETSDGLGWHFDVETTEKVRFNRKYQRLEVLSLVPSIKRKLDPVDGYCALNKCLLKLHRREPSCEAESGWRKYRNIFADLNFNDDEHLFRSPSFGTLTLKRRWIRKAA